MKRSKGMEVGKHKLDHGKDGNSLWPVQRDGSDKPNETLPTDSEGHQVLGKGD